MNTKLNQPISLKKELSNIPEDLQISQQIITPRLRPFIPLTSKPKKKFIHTSEVKIPNKLKKIISINTNVKNKSYSYNKLRQTNQINGNSQYGRFLNSNIKEQLPILQPVNNRKRTKSVLDKILDRRDIFLQAYFDDLKREDNKNKKKQIEQYGQSDIQFQFPQIKVGLWKIRGYIKGQHVLLKGKKKNEQACLKKYKYQKVYEKIRKDYQSWVQSKFSFQN